MRLRVLQHRREVRAQLAAEGFAFRQGKTGARLLAQLRATVEQPKALKPKVPGEYLLKKQSWFVGSFE